MASTVDFDCMLCVIFENRPANAEITIAIVLNIIVTITTVTGNSLLLAVFIKTRSLHTPANMLLIALCISDLLVGVIVLPLFTSVLPMREWMVPYTLYYVYRYAFLLCDGLSFLCLIFIALDRYLAVCFPFMYERNATCTRIICLVVITSVIWTIYSVVSFVHIKAFLTGCAMVEFLVFAVIVFCYLKVYRVVSYQRKIIFRMGNTVARDGRQDAMRRNHELNRTHTISVILVCFSICFLPSYCFLIYYLVNLGSSCGNADQMHHISFWSTFLVLANSAINPVIYCLRRTDIRRAIKMMFRPANRRIGFSPKQEKIQVYPVETE